MAGRVQLVQSVIHSMLTYSISIYVWPVSLLKDLEKEIRNFIWSGDKDKRKLISVSWKKVCRHWKQGGLNLRSFISLNQATNLKLCWNLINSQKPCAALLKDRVLRNNKSIKHHIFSSFWSSIKEEYSCIQSNSIWLLGDGKDISFWNDPWFGQSLADLLNIPEATRPLLKSTVNEYIHNNQWKLLRHFVRTFPATTHLIQNVSIPKFVQKDQLLWRHASSGNLLLKDAYDFKNHKYQNVHWAECILNKDIPPARSLFVWRFMHNKVPTDENLMITECNLPSMCSICLKCFENSFHLFFECHLATKLWACLANVIRLPLLFTSKEDIWNLCDKAWSPQCNVVLQAVLVNLIDTIWYVKNQARFNNKSISWRSAISMIIASTSLSGNHTNKVSNNSIRDFTILKAFNCFIHHPRPPVSIEVLWQPPQVNWIKCNIDGASNVNPGNSACGGIFRDHDSNVILCFSEPLGICTAYHAELCAFMRAVETIHLNQWNNIWIETDLSLVIMAYKNSN